MAHPNLEPSPLMHQAVRAATRAAKRCGPDGWTTLESAQVPLLQRFRSLEVRQLDLDGANVPLFLSKEGVILEVVDGLYVPTLLSDHKETLPKIIEAIDRQK